MELEEEVRGLSVVEALAIAAFGGDEGQSFGVVCGVFDLDELADSFRACGPSVISPWGGLEPEGQAANGGVAPKTTACSGIECALEDVDMVLVVDSSEPTRARDERCSLVGSCANEEGVVDTEGSSDLSE